METIGTLLYQLIFMPLQLMFENIYYLLGFKLTKDPGLSIIVLSLTVNLLVLPLYNRADAVQEEERKIDAKLRKGVEHIKKTFKGDEQLMMLQTYYRQNNYSPLDAVKGSVSLFLEIPFFVAAYQFLSHLPILNGAALGPIKDLGAADGLLTLGGMTVNVLPIIMTVVNLAATSIFVKGMALKTKLQLYTLAFFFLVFLYNSPAGLVCYWTLNNLFNLVKTIVYKIKGNPVDLHAKQDGISSSDKKVFFAGAVFLAILTGLLIPSSVISASPQEFVIPGYLDNPLWYLAMSFALGLGAFVLWVGVFYWLGESKTRIKYELCLWAASGAAIVTYMFWGKNSSLLNPVLRLANGLQHTHQQKLINALVVLAVCALMYFLWKRYQKYVHEILSIGCIAMLGMSCFNIYTIGKSVEHLAGHNQAETGKLNEDSSKLVLSRHGKNVVVLMLDGALGVDVPYIFKQKPELQKKFAGFTYYKNTISFGSHTIFGSPGIFGGYEYTPLAMNKRDKQLLRDKHNEAMLLLPVLFSRNGFKATVSGLPLVNYQWIPDYTPFKKYPEIRIENFGKPLQQVVTEEELHENIVKNERNFFCYGLMKALPLVAQNALYTGGRYNRFDRIQSQTIKNTKLSHGYDKSFMECYRALEDMTKRTRIVDEGNTFLAMTNDITHDSALLQEPDYVPAEHIDNSATADFNAGHYVVDGKRLAMKSVGQVAKYHVNMAAFLKLGAWFDYLRQQGVYDNTRIILVADHGGATGQSQALLFKDRVGKLKGKGLNNGDATAFFPLLMVKDFNQQGLQTSTEFMTNADVPALALKGIVTDPVNPFTKQAITTAAKEAPEQYIMESSEYEIRYNSGNTYQPARWFAVKNNIWEKENWRLAKEKAVMPY